MPVARKTIMDVFADPVMSLATLPRRVDVHVDTSKMLEVMEKLVSHLTSNAVSIADR